MRLSRLADEVLQFSGRFAGRLGISHFFFESALRRSSPEKFPVLIHFVCQGNILRSAYAAERFKQILKERDLRDYTVSSSGTMTDLGKLADPNGIKAAKTKGVSLENHRTTPIDASTLAEAWLIVTMDRKVHHRVGDRFPEHGGKRLLLASLLLPEGKGPNVRDPYGKSLGVVVETFTLIDQALEKLVEELPTSRVTTLP